MISNLSVLKRLFAVETDGSTEGTDEATGGESRPEPELRSKLGLFLALVVLTALGEATLRGIRRWRSDLS